MPPEHASFQAGVVRASDTHDMREHLVRQGWLCSVLLMILGSTIVGLCLLYAALFALLGGAWDGSVARLGVAGLAAFAVKWLCVNRNDLVEC